ncbi:MAG: protocatechuate 3,4-dioxygenase subunit alpha [Microbacterium sp.]
MTVPEKTHTPTAGQTIGPFFRFGLEYDRMNEIAFPHSEGAIMVKGVLYDAEGAPIPDGLVEIFGADSDGSIPRERGSLARDGATFTGFGRCMTNDWGEFRFWTRNPGSIDGKAPFFATVVYARGLPNKLHTRIYLPDDEAALAEDALLKGLDEAERATLVATRGADGSLTHDIRLQGDGETVFLAY